MSELKCNCGRATHTGLGCGPDLPRTPYDRQAELATLRAENARLRAALEEALPWLKRDAHREITQRAEAALAGKEQA